MAILQQKNGEYTSYLGWYGECGQTTGQTFELSSNENIHTVYKTSSGGVMSYSHGVPEFMQVVKILEPGNSYWVTLKPGDGTQVNIPGFVISDSEDPAFGGDPSMISDCSTVVSEPTPTPEKTPTPAAAPTPTPQKPEVKTVLMPVILYGFDTGNQDTSLHFTSNKLKFENNSSRFCTFSDIDDMFNGENYSWPILSGSKGETGSIKEYYKSISFGQLDVEFVILPAGSSDNPSSNNPNDYAWLINDDWKKYGEYKNGSNQGHRIERYKDLHNQFRKMFSHIRLNLRKQGKDFDKMFWSGVPITFINPGFSAASSGGPDRFKYLWPHKWAFSYSGKWQTYNVNPFLSGLSAVADPAKATITTIGVVAHETLHAFGLPDLYDTSYQGTGINATAVMASGSYGNASHSAAYLPSYAISWSRNELSKRKLFDTEIVEIQSSTSDIEIAPAVDVNKLYRIHHPTTTDVWWVDFRTKDAVGATGLNFDKLINESGLAIVHEGGSPGPKTNKSSRTPSHRRGETGYYISLEQRDGRFQSQTGYRLISGDLYRPGDEFSPHTIPSTVARSGEPSGIKVHNIRKTDNGTMLFDVTYITEPDYKIVSVDYNFGNKSYPVTSTARAVWSRAQYGGNVVATIVTSGIADGTTISMSLYPYADINATGTVQSDTCEITISALELGRYAPASKDPRPAHIKYTVDPNSDYGSAFGWNDYIKSTY